MTNFTNEQLEAWAGLGPWGHRVDIVRAEEGETFPWGTIYKDLPDPITLVYMTLQPDSIKSNAALIAAAPALAATLLAERKAREVEVGELRAAVEKARLTFNRYGDLHSAKPDEANAARNYELADEMDRALNKDQPHD